MVVVSSSSFVALRYVPALFCVVHGDTFISNKHSELLHGKYAGDKFILAVEGRGAASGLFFCRSRRRRGVSALRRHRDSGPLAATASS